MSEAFVCDRCGATISGQPPLKVACPGLGAPAGMISAKVVDDKDNRRGILQEPVFQTNRAEWSVDGGDLCDGCADEFREFWDVNEDT